MDGLFSYHKGGQRMPLTLPQKTKTLVQELKEKAQNGTAGQGTADRTVTDRTQSLGIMAGSWDALIPRGSDYLQPTNIAAIRELNNLGVDTSKINKEFFERNATLKQYASIGMNGLPVAPGAGSSREEKAAYYYTKLLNAENQTVRAETELAGLNREISYWAGRKDRNYSDDEITKRIDWNKYPTLNVMREELKRGRPVPLNRGIDFGGDTVNGMLWSARNGKGSGSHTVNAVKYALGVGNTYHADPDIRAKLDRKASRTTRMHLAARWMKPRNISASIRSTRIGLTRTRASSHPKMKPQRDYTGRLLMPRSLQ
jgi:hypothetical protein